MFSNISKIQQKKLLNILTNDDTWIIVTLSYHLISNFTGEIEN